MANWLEPMDQSRTGLFDLIREFDNWFGSSGRANFGVSEFDIEEQDGSYSISIDMPGVKANDVKMEAQGNRLMIQAERSGNVKSDSGASKSSMRYQRVFTLPESVDSDQIEASLENGVLQILVPKSAEMSPRKIQVSSTHRQLSGESQGTQETQNLQGAREKKVNPEVSAQSKH